MRQLLESFSVGAIVAYSAEYSWPTRTREFKRTKNRAITPSMFGYCGRVARYTSNSRVPVSPVDARCGRENKTLKWVSWIITRNAAQGTWSWDDKLQPTGVPAGNTEYLGFWQKGYNSTGKYTNSPVHGFFYRHFV